MPALIPYFCINEWLLGGLALWEDRDMCRKPDAKVYIL